MVQKNKSEKKAEVFSLPPKKLVNEKVRGLICHPGGRNISSGYSFT